MSFRHETVLRDELVNALNLKPGDIGIDCTLGGGGHTEKILEAVGKDGLVIALDRDQVATSLTSKRLQNKISEGNLKIINNRFANLKEIVAAQNLTGKVAGICADIGLSSEQLAEPSRGFSFLHEGPLDMRMGETSASSTAAEIVNEASLDELTDIFRRYGEEPKARRIASRIVQERAKKPITTTRELATLVENSLHYREKSKRHPATRVFQALRIAVNDELGELENLVKSGFQVLKSGGRLAIITFHSLEDRLVKHAFLNLTGRGNEAPAPREAPLTDEQVQKLRQFPGRIVKPFPLVPSDEEILRNPRARSAKLRVIEKK